MTSLSKILLSIIVVMMCLGTACSPAPVAREAAADTSTQQVSAVSELTYFPTDEWRSSTPEEQGVDSALILQMFQKIQDEKINIHSVLLVRNGRLVTEAYFAPYTQKIKHPVYSATKSVTSILTGIAMQAGYIKSVDQKALDFFPDIAQEVKDEKLKNLTLAHLLTMSAGYNTRTIPQAEALSQKDASFDTVKHILTYNSILTKPGTTFFYDSGAPHVLSAIIQQTTGMTTLEYAQKELFDPLGITGVTWQTDPRGIALGCTGLELSPRDMAKIGYLYLNHGQWNGTQLVPAEWVDQSTTKHMETKGLMNEAENDGYGYFWWIDAYGGYSAHGFGGQYIFVVPKLQLVAVFTSGLADPVFPTPRKLMESFILPAAKSTGPLTPSPSAAKLQTYTAQLENPAPVPVAPLPEIAKQISGQTFEITKSPVPYVKTIQLTFNDRTVYQSKSVWPDGKIYQVTGGLDNRFYLNEGVQGMNIVLKGYWQDDKTFIETLQDLSQIDTETHKYTFTGDKLTVDVNSGMGFYSFQMSGELAK